MERAILAEYFARDKGFTGPPRIVWATLRADQIRNSPRSTERTRRAVLEGLRGRLGARLDARPLGAWECGEAMPGLAPTTYRPVLALSLAIAERGVRRCAHEARGPIGATPPRGGRTQRLGDPAHVVNRVTEGGVAR